MNPTDIHLLAIIAECEPATYGDISMQSQIAGHFLGLKLDNLTDRGFIHVHESRYRLAKGVKESLPGLSSTTGMQ